MIHLQHMKKVIYTKRKNAKKKKGNYYAIITQCILC